MKKPYLFFLLFLFCTAGSLAQGYQSLFGKQSTYWIFEQDPTVIWSVDTIFVEKDTLINVEIYKKLIEGQKRKDLVGFVREDTIAGKVWTLLYNQFNVLEEKLLFDFSLNKGDTFVNDQNFYPYQASLSVVDSVYYRNNLKHIVFKEYYDTQGWPYAYREPYVFIEGIGGNLGIEWKTPSFALSSLHYLLCSYKDGVQTSYRNAKYNGSCVRLNRVGLEEEKQPAQVTIYPNPFQDEFTLTVASANTQITKLNLTDITGKVMFVTENLHFTQDRSYTIGTRNLPAGVYLVYITSVSGEVIVRRVVKQ